MSYTLSMEVPKWALQTMNNIYDIERKLTIHGDNGNATRNVEKIKEAFSEINYFYEDPLGQEFKETRTDLEATISGTSTDNLVVVEVIKPIVRYGDSKYSKVVQKGIVIVESVEKGNSK